MCSVTLVTVSEGGLYAADARSTDDVITFKRPRYVIEMLVNAGYDINSRTHRSVAPMLLGADATTQFPLTALMLASANEDYSAGGISCPCGDWLTICVCSHETLLVLC